MKARRLRSQPNPHRALISFLESPASYPHLPPQVRSIQTHISWVFIVSPFVFKVKKSVNLGFLDFSTLEKRRYFCQRELELNRRLAPEIYLEVVPIYEGPAGFSFETKGEIAEYAVKMRELPDGWFLSELLANGLVGEKEINRVASCLHRFYDSQEPSIEIEEWGRPQKLKISTDENFRQVEPFIGKTISPVAFETIRHFTNHFYAAKESLFRERIQQHRIRDCHGDLHLDHIHITPDALSIFDCIEFNDRFRFIDIANDLAFLATDFDFEGERELAKLLLERAASEFGDPGILKVANFYKCYRAFVRGKVESIQVGSKDAPDPEEHRKQAARYFRLALQYAVSGSEPLLLIVMGRVGTGKTTVARQLGIELDWPVFSSDQIRKTLAGIPSTGRTAAERRDEVYSAPMTQQTYKQLVEEALAVLGCHSRGRPDVSGPRATYGGVILDATFSSRTHRQFLRNECEKAHVRFQLVELDVDPGQIERRLKSRDQIAGEISDARLEDLEKLNALYEPPSEFARDLTVVSANNSVSDTVKSVLLQLTAKEHR